MNGKIRRTARSGRRIRTVVRIVAMALLLFSAVACKDDPIKEYGDALLRSHARSKQVAGDASLEAIRTTIQAFEISNGRYPESLEEIREGFSGSVDWDRYTYDPATGTVSVNP